jgi:hypothetical protein
MFGVRPHDNARACTSRFASGLGTIFTGFDFLLLQADQRLMSPTVFPPPINRENRRYRKVGSRRSRSQSPMMLIDRVVRMITALGNSRIHEARVRYSRP